MSASKRTPWFPASCLPVREGVYECVWSDKHWDLGGQWKNYFTPGKGWSWGSLVAERAAGFRHDRIKPEKQKYLLRWRGLTRG